MEVNELKTIKANFQVVVVGGGLSGLCAAIASARHGAKTALIQERPVLGGNASGEIRMHICGASASGRYDNARETGIIEEILLENRKRNYHDEFPLFDIVMWEKARFQKNLTLYLNTHMRKVETEKERISRVICSRLGSETELIVEGEYFIDATGDGTLGAFAGAQYMRGSESRDVFEEPHAPEKADGYTMGNTILFSAMDRGRKVGFEKPEWAYDVPEEMLKNRDHSQISYGYWWIELGGMDSDIIKDYEQIKDELLKWAFGIWDHIKNKGDHKADNYELTWVGMLPGKRESRRLTGDYVLREQDLASGRVFDDAVAYGGWPMDMHVPGGLKNHEKQPSMFIFPEKYYTIPYRCLYSKNIGNLFLAGRAISVSKLAFGSTRVMGTTSVAGQAAGAAAAMAVEYGISPRDMNLKINELQKKLMADDCFIPGYRYMDERDLAAKAEINCSSEKHSCKNVVNGHTRNIEDTVNYWESENLTEEQFIRFDLDESRKISKVKLLFDSNLSREIRISMAYNANKNQLRGVPREIVKDYDVELLLAGERVAIKKVENNHLRKNEISFDGVGADSVKVTVHSTNGWPTARIFDVKIF